MDQVARRVTPPTVSNKVLSIITGDQENRITVGSHAWFVWLAAATRFVLVSTDITIQVRRERAGNGRGSGYWRAYHKQRGVVHRVYLGRSEEMTDERLQAAADTLATLAALDMPSPVRPPIPPVPELLLPSKLFLPLPRPDTVERRTILARLDRAQSGRLTVLTAPPGFGKTTVLSAWIASRPVVQAAWLALDTDDNDPLVFLRYLVAALRTIAPSWGVRTATLLYQPASPSLAEMLSFLGADLATIPHVTLVLDDYHLITEQAVHQIVTMLINQPGVAFHLILATRSDVPLTLTRLRAAGTVSEIRTDALRFSADEAEAFLHETMHIDLTAEQFATLAARTEGWAAGLQLAALALQNRRDAAAFIAAFGGTHQFVIDYLVSEVLNCLSTATVSFLLHTAIVERICGPLAEALVANDSSDMRNGSGQALLEHLDRSNLFVVPLDDQRQWYRYHQLFGEMLRQRLIQQESSETIAALHMRASTWFDQHGLLPEAIHHALMAGASAQAATLVERIGLRLFVQGGGRSPLMGWLAALPQDIVQRRPRLGLFRFVLHFEQQEFVAAVQALEQAEQALQTADPAVLDIHIFNDLAIGRLLVDALTGRVALEKLRAQTKQLVHEAHTISSPLHSVLMAAQSAVHLMQGEVAQAARDCAKIARFDQHRGNDFLALISRSHQYDLQRAQGMLALTDAACRATLAWAAERGLQHAKNATLIAITLIELLCERNMVTEASAVARQYLAPWQEQRSLDQPVIHIFPLTRLAVLQGELDHALQMVQEARYQLDDVWTDDLQSLLAGLEARVQMARGATDAALTAAALTHNVVSGHRRLAVVPFVYTYEYGPIVHAETLIAHGCATGKHDLIEQARTILSALQQSATMQQLPWFQIKTQVLLALSYEALENPTAAAIALAVVLRLAAPEGYVRAILDVGPTVLTLLRHIPAEQATRAFQRRLLHAAHQRDSNVTRNERQATANAIDSVSNNLTTREHEVLRLMAAGLSNGDIAHQLIISAATVKKHIHNIVTKLDAQSRIQAVARARAYGLLDSPDLRQP